MTPRSTTTEHLRRVFESGRLITINDLREMHDGITKQAIHQKVANGDLPRPLGTIGPQTMVWDREEVLDYMIRRRG